MYFLLPSVLQCNHSQEYTRIWFRFLYTVTLTVYKLNTIFKNQCESNQVWSRYLQFWKHIIFCKSWWIVRNLLFNIESWKIDFHIKFFSFCQSFDWLLLILSVKWTKYVTQRKLTSNYELLCCQQNIRPRIHKISSFEIFLYSWLLFKNLN